MSINKKYKLKGLIGEVLTILEPRVTKLMNDYQVEYVLKFKKSPSKFDLECTEMYLVLDIIKSFGKYTKSDDKIVEIKSSTSIKGNLEINGVIKRDKVDYNFRTEAIYAGGYNVQRLHYRYLTKTKLPQSVSPIVKEFNERIKKMNKIERIEQDIKRLELLLSNTKENIEKYEKYTDEQRLKFQNRSGYIWPTWKEICKRGADKNYEYSEEYYKSEKEKSKLRELESFQRVEIDCSKERIKYYEKDLKKMNLKLEDLK